MVGGDHVCCKIYPWNRHKSGNYEATLNGQNLKLQKVKKWRISIQEAETATKNLELLAKYDNFEVKIWWVNTKRHAAGPLGGCFFFRLNQKECIQLTCVYVCSSYVFWNCRFVFLNILSHILKPLQKSVNVFELCILKLPLRFFNILSQILKPLQNQWMRSSYVFWNCRFVFFKSW